MAAYFEGGDDPYDEEDTAPSTSSYTRQMTHDAEQFLSMFRVETFEEAANFKEFSQGILSQKY